MPKEEQSHWQVTVVVITNSQPRVTKSNSAELYRCKRKAEGKFEASNRRGSRQKFKLLLLSPIASQQPNQLQQSYIDCKRKAEGKIGSQQTMTASQNLLSVDK
jgi:hypothetical protein